MSTTNNNSKPASDRMNQKRNQHQQTSASFLKRRLGVNCRFLAATILFWCVLWNGTVSAGDTKSGFMPTPDTLISNSTKTAQTKLSVSVPTKSDCTMTAENGASKDTKPTERNQTAKTLDKDTSQPNPQRIKLLSYHAFYDHTGKNLSNDLIDDVWIFASDPILPERQVAVVHNTPTIAKRGQSWLYRALLDPSTLKIIDAGWILVAK
ncbi:MAG: hypothetical protein HUU55_23060 [Myxococcales bacterium]|nr:hypothetical protein [Myxococcales bacterium]